LDIFYTVVFHRPIYLLFLLQDPAVLCFCTPLRWLDFCKVKPLLLNELTLYSECTHNWKETMFQEHFARLNTTHIGFYPVPTTLREKQH
jgi:hypothetical protein